MGDLDADIAVIKNDIAHIKNAVDEIKNNCQKRDEDCDCKFNELYNAKSDHSLKLEKLKGQISFHDWVIGGLGALFLALIAIAGDLVTWLRGG